jgi:hypothetical protein
MQKECIADDWQKPKIKSSRMEGKWASSDRFHMFFFHSFMLKCLAMGFLAQYAKILKQTHAKKGYLNAWQRQSVSAFVARRQPGHTDERHPHSASR